ncbi:nucleotide exchange factor GrpE [Pseudidiomarina insulisalsae]|uniref:Protein GrpE n=1 Tax=Pseudidiomarina insulisalsae TaxID=575789 RepID=A0A432YEP3_9GAMM|nr:nucleotide exchange factor GrpE [Pseudidiomarina insulisalsae]RUO59411.1 nucleotide exchange factor GrpE [Pseudidiomarina insulisalsae]
MTKHDQATENEQNAATEQQPESQSEAAAEAEENLTSEVDERIAELELALSQAEQRAEESKDRAVRAVAEMENVRRRASQDVEKAHKFALEKFANEILTTVDNLERALAIADQEETINENFLEGIQLTHKNLLSTLNKFGIEAVGEEGEAFNPDLHQAMSMQAAEGKENNTVLAVMQKGYTLSGRLLRPAMVMVVKN